MSFKLGLRHAYNIIDDAKCRNYAFLGLFRTIRERAPPNAQPECLGISIQPFLVLCHALDLSSLIFPVVRKLLAQTHLNHPHLDPSAYSLG